ncbi:MAG: STT3 domain-containing protein [Candidatus Omnitrophota bacterium]|nr:STT3 domain-containing protein [Candidatus Omnitrophota bacterium]MDZ4243317.1 STT3 domain-containing protein [Candidatus Omnitrophota bacterium]
MTGNKILSLLLFAAMGAVVWGLGIYFRLYPLLNHTSHNAFEKASMIVVTNLRQKITETLQGQSPDMPPVSRNQLATRRLNDLLHTQGAQVRKTILQVAREMDKLDPSRQPFPYLLASDGFYYFRLTRNIAETGAISTAVKGSKYFNPMMQAPLGYWEPLNLHPYVGFLVYKILSLFSPGIPLMFAVSFTAPFMTALILAAFLWVASCLNLRPPAVFVGAVFFVLAPIFIKRSMFAWYDNDPYSLLFPLLSLGIVFTAIDNRGHLRRVLLLAVWASLCVSLYALFWQGWVFLLSILVLGGFLAVIAHLILTRSAVETRNLAFFFGALTAGAFFAVAVIFGIKDFFILFQEGFTALNDFLNQKISLWPDMYIAVGELRKATPGMIVELTGGVLPAALAAFGLAMAIQGLRRGRPTDNLMKVLVMFVFLSVAVFLSLGAQRFILLVLVPMGLLAALGIHHLLGLLSETLPPLLKKHNLPAAIRPALIALLVTSCLAQALLQAQRQTPTLLNQIYNGTWDKALAEIRDKTPADSIVNSWWPPGHFISSMARRRVTFDGATISKPQAYWMASVFMANDEKTALGILRMLNTSSNSATDYLLEKGMPLSRAIKLLKSVVSLNRGQALTKLRSELDAQQAEHVLTLTHGQPPPSYLFVYNDLAEKHQQLPFVARWNFEKAEKISRSPELKSQVPAKKSASYASFLWEMAGGIPRVSDPMNLVSRNADTILFTEGMKVNLNDMTCTVNSEKYGQGTPFSVIYPKGDSIAEDIQPAATLPYTALLSLRGDLVQAFLMERDIAKSLIMRLYYLEGKGLKYLRPFAKERDLTGRTQIYVYEVLWEEYLKDIGDRP